MLLPCDIEIHFFTLKLFSMTHRPCADSIDQDLTAQNVQSHLGSTVSDKEVKEFLIPKKSCIQTGIDSFTLCSCYNVFSYITLS